MEQVSFSGAQPSTNQGPRAASESGEEIGHTAGQYLDKALNLIGAKMRAAATLVKEKAPKEGVSKNAFESASRALDSTGQYMMREQPTRELGGIIRRYPLRSLGICLVVGLAAGNVLRNSRRAR
jgi:hypothetical protein